MSRTWNHKFELLNGSYFVSNIQDYIKYITNQHETLSTHFYIQVYTNRINNRLVFKI